MSFIGGLLATWPARVVAGAALIAVVGGVVIAPRIAAQPQAADIRTAQVTRANITETILVSGAVSAAGELNLAFESAGKIAEVLVSVGDQVTAGQALARLGVSDLELDVRQAEADLATAEARYQQALRGATAEEVAIARHSVDNAVAGYRDAERKTASDIADAEEQLERTEAEYRTARAKLASTLATLENALDDHVSGIEGVHEDALRVRDALIAIFRPGDITTARDELNEADLALTTAEEFLTAALAPARAEFDTASATALATIAAFDAAVAGGDDTLDEEQAFETTRRAFEAAAGKLSTAVDAASGELGRAQGSLTTARETLSSPGSLPLSLLDEERRDLAAVQTALLAEEQRAPAVKSVITQAAADMTELAGLIGGGYSAALDGVDTAKESATSTLASEQNAIRSAELSLAKTTASPAAADVASAYASLLSQQVGLDRARIALENATLVSPGPGVVSAISAQAGERVSATADALITVAQTGTLTVQGTVGETDVARLRMGQVATVTVDAVGSDVRMTGRVTRIDPVATIEQGVPVYGVDVLIDIPDPAIRAGMSGVATVVVASKQNVLTVPNAAIRTTNGVKTIQVLREGNAVPASVAFGISNDTVTEVMSGLEEGDLVVLPTRTTSTTPQQPFGGAGAGGGVQIRRP